MNMNDKFIDVLKATHKKALLSDASFEDVHTFLDCFVMAKQMGVIE